MLHGAGCLLQHGSCTTFVPRSECCHKSPLHVERECNIGPGPCQLKRKPTSRRLFLAAAVALGKTCEELRAGTEVWSSSVQSRRRRSSRPGSD